MDSMTALWNRLRERKLVQWALAYLAGAWLFLQVLALLGNYFGWPLAVGRIATVLLGVGFLGTAVLSWYHGERGEQRVGGMELAMFAVLCVLAGAGVSLVGGSDRAGAVDGAGVEAGIGPTSTGLPLDRSVVILPFANLSSDPEQEYFSDGITEEIPSALVRLPGLRVPGRATSFSFKGKNLPIPEIAAQLNVRHVLEGSVRRSGDRVRITAQLVDATTDTHLWSESYDRQLTDIFTVQEEIARSIASTLQVRLTEGGQTALVAHRTEDPEAYNLYLHGRDFWNRRGAENLRIAIDYFSRAVARDPGFARAHAALAESYATLPDYADVDPEEYWPLAQRAAARAIELDPRMAPAYGALGLTHRYTGEWSLAEAEFGRAIQLDPAYPPLHGWHCLWLGDLGRLEEAIAACSRAIELDPLYAAGNMQRGFALVKLRRYDEAVAQLERTLQIDPTFTRARAYLAAALALQGEMARALDEANRVLSLPGTKSTWDLSLLGYVFAVAGREQQARDILAEMDRRREAGSAVSPTFPATVLIALGEHDRALQLLRWPLFDPVRDDSRFRDAMRRLGLAPG